MTARQFPNWQELYRDQPVEQMPWYYPQLDPDLERALKARGITDGKALDLGTGPGTQAYALAAQGFDVTASDLSSHAVELGLAGNAKRGLQVKFVQDDILHTRLHGGFDVVFDRGCFHVFAPELRARYVHVVRGLLAPAGTLFLKCFSDRQGGDFGPYRISPAEIQQAFGAFFDVIDIEHTVYQGMMAQLPRALFCTLRLKQP